MRYPNLRYGNPAELAYYAAGIPIPMLARRLRRDERTVKDWLNEKKRIPWWVPEVLRLQQKEVYDLNRQMLFKSDCYKIFTRPPLATVTELGQFERKPLSVKKPQSMTELRLDDFDQVQLASGA